MKEMITIPKEQLNSLQERLHDLEKEMIDLKQPDRCIRNYQFNLLEYARDIVLLINKKTGHIIEANHAAVRAYGYEKEALLSLNIYDIQGKGTKQLVQEQMAMADKNGILFETLHVRKDGTNFPVEVNSIAVDLDDEGGLLSIIRDITERKKAEAALMSSEKFIEDILTSIDEAFVVVDRDYRILSANRAYCDQAGKSLGHIIGAHCYEISHHTTQPCHEPGQVCACKSTFETGEPGLVFHTHTDDKGKQRLVEVKTFAMKSASGEVQSVIEVINDITEKRALESQLRHAQIDGGHRHPCRRHCTRFQQYPVRHYRLRTYYPHEDAEE